MLIHLNHYFRGIQLGFTRLSRSLSSRLSGPSAGLRDAASKLTGSPLEGRLEERLPLFLERAGRPKLGVMWTAALRQVPNTQISSQLISAPFVSDYCSTFDSAKPLCSCCDETGVRRAAGWRARFMFSFFFFFVRSPLKA